MSSTKIAGRPSDGHGELLGSIKRSRPIMRYYRLSRVFVFFLVAAFFAGAFLVAAFFTGAFFDAAGFAGRVDFAPAPAGFRAPIFFLAEAALLLPVLLLVLAFLVAGFLEAAFLVAL
ncbi:MAG: hypothetical protein VW373_07770, partial [Halieaceae bacterium]